MMIIFEGCDCVGKTTLAAECDRLLEGRNKFLHFGAPETIHSNPYHEYEGTLMPYRPGMSDRHWLVDRLHWGEYIYGPIYRGHSRLSVLGLDHVNLFLRSRGALTVYVSASPKTVLRRMNEKGEDFLREDDVLTVLDQMERVATRASRLTRVLHVSTDATDATELAEGIILAAAHLEREAVRLVNHPEYIGPINPRVLLVGEKSSDGNPLPFVPYAGNSGEYLLQAVSAKLPWIGIRNAYPHPARMRSLWEVLGRPKVVSLGQRAYDTLRSSRLGSAQVNHPQWWRRFRHHRQEEFAEEVLKAGGLI